MRNILVLLMLSFYLYSTTEFVQLLKVPVLISHFIEHKEDNANMSFLDYIIHHYGGHEMDADWETDMKLPFMTQSDLLFVTAVPPGKPNDLLGKTIGLEQPKNTNYHQEDNIPNSYLSSIWQPPKF